MTPVVTNVRVFVETGNEGFEDSKVRWEQLTIAILVLEGSLARGREPEKYRLEVTGTYEKRESLLELGDLLLGERISLFNS